MGNGSNVLIPSSSIGGPYVSGIEDGIASAYDDFDVMVVRTGSVKGILVPRTISRPDDVCVVAGHLTRCGTIKVKAVSRVETFRRPTEVGAWYKVGFSTVNFSRRKGTVRARVEVRNRSRF